ncbi:8615_t:CDS:1, partial [Racocetra persica]
TITNALKAIENSPNDLTQTPKVLRKIIVFQKLPLDVPSKWQSSPFSRPC